MHISIIKPLKKCMPDVYTLGVEVDFGLRLLDGEFSCNKESVIRIKKIYKFIRLITSVDGVDNSSGLPIFSEFLYDMITKCERSLK